MMPPFLAWVFLALSCYGVGLLFWAGLKQKRRGKIKSSRYFFAMAASLGVAVTVALVVRFLRS